MLLKPNTLKRSLPIMLSVKHSKTLIMAGTSKKYFKKCSQKLTNKAMSTSGVLKRMKKTLRALLQIALPPYNLSLISLGVNGFKPFEGSSNFLYFSMIINVRFFEN